MHSHAHTHKYIYIYIYLQHDLMYSLEYFCVAKTSLVKAGLSCSWVEWRFCDLLCLGGQGSVGRSHILMDQMLGL